MSRLADLAGPVSDRVQIGNVILAETVARRQPVCKGLPADLALHVNVTTETNENDLLIQVLPRFSLVGHGGAENSEEVLRIEAVFVVQYRVPTFHGITKENINAFGEMNGVYNVWPYWREFVQSMTVRMGLPPLTVPVFRPLAGGVAQRPKNDAPPAESADLPLSHGAEPAMLVSARRRRT
jgi:hypothetical protein